MKRISFPFLSLFQDPVFTILALILLATTPMIFPGEGKKIDPQVPILMEEIHALEKAVSELQGTQKLLEQNKEGKDLDYQGLAQSLQGLRQKNLDLRETAEDQRRNLNRLNHDVQVKRREVEQLKNDLARLGTRQGPVPGGFYDMGDSTKQDFYIQLAGNRLYPVDDEYYNSKDVYGTIAGGEMVAVLVKTRKTGTPGDQLEDLERPANKLENVLQGLDSRQNRIIFLVQGNSFPIFRKAREQVFRRGFECGWIFTNSQDITLTSASRAERLPSAAPR
ncbi:MAG: hypothetical protein FJ135_03905 [Deltaproteobacteria bacterium]|nr:hypothetical protein [Deltaproteobacteria bacterium]